MKTKIWLALGAMLTTGLLAQQVTNVAPAASTGAPPAVLQAEPAAAPPAVVPAAPETQVAPEKQAAPETKPAAPAKKSSKKKSAKQPAKKEPVKKAAAPELRSDPLKPGPATVVASNVNVRGQAKLRSEVVTRLTKGQNVTVLEEVVLKKSAADEPSAWAKIVLPEGVRVWVHGNYIDAATKTVAPRKLNVRSGPGENYSVLGQMLKGDQVKEVSTSDGWIQIEAPTNAYAFMAAQYLQQEAPASEPTPTPVVVPEPAPTPAIVGEPPQVAAAPTETPAMPTDTQTTPATPASTNLLTEAAPLTNEPAITTPESTPETAPEPAPEEPLPPRIVQREGIVRGSTSIQAPTAFALVSTETGRTINYLYTTSPHLDLMRYKGLRIVVTGEEGLDPRWRNTPVITIQKIQVIE